MKIYQCIHKYPPHIPLFERKYGIAERENITFEELRQLVIADGYASSYILQPALEGKIDRIFYTIWDYERLQLLWAKENSITTTNLTEIKLAQIESFSPDVIYDHSAFIDRDFVKKLKHNSATKCCWYSIIQKEPESFSDYDIRFTLHKPYVDSWTRNNILSFELQPAIPHEWLEIEGSSKRDIDVLFYGQYFEGMFSNRNEIINELIKYSCKKDYNIKIFLQYNTVKKTAIPIKGFRKFKKITYPPRYVRKHSFGPIYGETLYSTIKRSKIVINAYTDFNLDYKSNMRLYEAIGCGAFLISEEGNYPEGFIPDVDFYTYTDSKSLFYQIKRVLSDWSKHSEIALATQKKIAEKYSKENQWDLFKKSISTFCVEKA